MLSVIKNKLLVVSFILIASVVLNSCKENTILPSTLVPTIDNIYTFGSDTFSVLTHNIYQDSMLTGGMRGTVRVSNSASLYHALGTITSDPVFGKTHASIHVEVLPPVANFAFKTNAPGTSRIIDSVVLSIPYRGSYGDTLSSNLQTLKVYRSLKQFSRDSAQYEFTKDSIDYTKLIATKTVDFKTLGTDSPLVGNIKLQPQVRFQLATWFTDSLQAQVDLGANGAAADFSKFLDWWRGFAIVPDTNNGSALGYFDTYNTRMYIYYRYTNTNNAADTTVDVFSFDPNNCNRFNTINHNYNGALAQKQLASGKPNGDSVLFVQTDPGIVAQVSLPYLANFENVVVNKAELIFTAVSPYYNWMDTLLYGATPRMQIIGSDSVGNDFVLGEYATFGANFVDGSQKTVIVNGLNAIQYKFIITQTIQNLISQKNTNFRLKISGSNSARPASYRMLLRGSGSQSTEWKPKLNLIYTILKK